MEPGSREFNAALLQDARGAFPQFFANATPAEVRMMEALVLGHAAMTVLLNAPRPRIDAPARLPLEQVGDQVDQLFAATREAVRGCPTFNAIAQSEREAIERLLFNIKAPRSDS